MTADREIVYFEEKDGKIFIRTELFAVYPGLGNKSDSMYTGEKMEENPVSPVCSKAGTSFHRQYSSHITKNGPPRTMKRHFTGL